MVACPGQDMIKVWPLPVERPWWEDSPNPEEWPIYEQTGLGLRR